MRIKLGHYISVFTRDRNGTLRHFYTAPPQMAPDIKERGIDLLAPIWHFLHLTRQGCGDWYASLNYGTKVQTASTVAEQARGEVGLLRIFTCYSR